MRKTQVRGLALCAAVAVSLSLTACGARGAGVSGGDDGTFTIKFSHVVTPETPKGKAAEKFKEVVEKNSGGRIKVQIYPNSELYGDKDELQALQSNSVQMLAPASAKFTTIAPELQVLDLPFLFDSVEDIPKVASPETQAGKAIYANKALAGKKIKPLGLWDNGLKQLSSNSEMRKPADVAGHSFRIQPSDVLDSQFKKWGASATPMAFSEVYNALQQGVVDGQENPYSNIESQNMHTVQKHITESNHGYVGYVLVINTDFFNKLPKDLQDTVVKAADEASTFNRQVAAQINEEAKQTILKSGKTKITKLSDAERQAFKDAVVPSVWREYEDVIGKEIIGELLKEQGQ
ncbi:MAG: DctP family TRAP transporter solute-binding subunit [Streptosporangiales bacterium]|nr:DctP family TRAP transporter solute-binding subunit [Streptosporangiales bacterium]